MRTSLSTVLLVLAFFVVLGPICEADIVINGSFENPDVPSTGYNEIPSIDNWVINESDPNQVLLFDRVDLPAPDGTQHLVFNGGGSSAGATVHQVLNANAGTLYDVAFWGGANVPSRSSFTVSFLTGSGLGGTEIISMSGNVGVLSSIAQTTFSFVAPTDVITLVIEDTSPLTVGSDLFVDHFSVVANIPEPTSCVLMGVVGVGLLVRRRR